MALMEISVVPVGTGNTSVSRYVAKIYDELLKRKARFSLNDMGTVVEGEAAELLALAAELHQLPFLMGADRVYTVIKLDDRRDKASGIGKKVASVESKSLEKGA